MKKTVGVQKGHKKRRSLSNDIRAVKGSGLLPSMGEFQQQVTVIENHTTLINMLSTGVFTSGDTPSITLLQDTSLGNPEQRWKVCGNHTGIRIEDTTAGTVPVKVLAGAPTDSVVITSAGNIGFGTTNPGYSLHVVRTGENAGLYLERTDSGTVFKLNVTTALAQIGSVSNHRLNFVVGNTARMTIDTNGYVGIGTTSPGYPMELRTTGEDAIFTIDRTDGTTGKVSAGLGGIQFGSLTDHKVHIVTGDGSGGTAKRISIDNSNGYVGIGTTNPEYPLEMKITGSNATFAINRTDGATAKITGGASGVQFGSQTDHQVKIVVNNSTTAITISNTANVGIGNTSPTHLLDVGISGAYCDGGAWINGSSRGYKENIRNLTAGEATEVLVNLNPVKFNYKGNKGEESLGFIAEDVPELVATKDRKGISAMDVVAVLTKVVQEQQKNIKELTQKIEGLEERIGK